MGLSKNQEDAEPPYSEGYFAHRLEGNKSCACFLSTWQAEDREKADQNEIEFQTREDPELCD